MTTTPVGAPDQDAPRVGVVFAALMLALMLAALDQARQTDAAEAFLEVAVDNDGAIAMYELMGFERTGLRKAYYDRGPEGFTDALVMRLDLNAGAA